MVPIHILLGGFDDYECNLYTSLSSDITDLVSYFRYVRGDIAECFTNTSEKVRNAIFSHGLPEYGV